MRRREWLEATGIIAAGAALGPSPGRAEIDAELLVEKLRLNLRHTWTTTMSSSEFRETVLVRYRSDGIEGLGEGAPIVRYDEDAAGAMAALDGIRGRVEDADPWALEALLSSAFPRLEGQYAARAALDIALHDWTGQRLGIPLYRLFGLDAADAPVTTFSIGIDTPEVTRRKVREAEPFPVLKIKVGLDSDEKWRAFAEQTYRLGDDGLLRYDWDLALAKPLIRNRGATPDLWKLYGALRRQPVLTLRGELSDVLSEETLARMAELKPDLKSVTVPGVGHTPMLDEPPAQTAIDEFIAEIDEREGATPGGHSHG